MNDEYIIPLFLPCAIVVVVYYLYTQEKARSFATNLKTNRRGTWTRNQQSFGNKSNFSRKKEFLGESFSR